MLLASHIQRVQTELIHPAGAPLYIASVNEQHMGRGEEAVQDEELIKHLVIITIIISHYFFISAESPSQKSSTSLFEVSVFRSALANVPVSSPTWFSV